MKVRRTITIDSELDSKIMEMVDEEIKRAIRNNKNLSSSKLRELMRKYNYSAVLEDLVRKGIIAKREGYV